MTKEEFLALPVKDQKSLVNEVIHSHGWCYFSCNQYGDQWHQRFIIVNKGKQEWRQWSLRTVTPLHLVCGIEWPDCE
ncbi:hypothetical protein ABIV32_001530 [Salmonella enterica subsp. enterica]